MNYNCYKAFDLAFVSNIKKEKTKEEVELMDSVFKRIKVIKQAFGLFMKDNYLNSENRHIVNLNKILHPSVSDIEFLRNYEVHLFEKDERSAIILGELSKSSPIIIYKKIRPYYHKVLHFNFPDEDESQILFFDNHERIKKKESYDKDMLTNNIKSKNEFILEILYYLENKLSENETINN